ncbi:MAG: hypothetical protein Q8R02_12335 [Hyphomonadaceae bacterium]|nr:hypothetical protein [Hyphomonadaceae bacterium]
MMSTRTRALLAVAVAALLAAPAALTQAAPQSASPQSATPQPVAPALPQHVKTAAEFVGDYKTPRLKDGKPDLQGFFTNATVSRMDRPNGYPLIINDEQAASLEGRAQFNVRLKTERSYVDPKLGAPEKGKALPGVGNYDVAYTDPGNAVINIKGELRSAYITFPENGRTPGMTEEGRKLRAAEGPARRGTGFDNPEERGNSERCIVIGTNGPPFANYLYNNNFQIVQTKDHFVIMSEMIHDTRIAKINGDFAAGAPDQYMGHSVAHWDGDTMVVETKGMRPGSGAFVSDNGKVVERFTRISDNQLLYEFEVNDPAVYTSVYRGQSSLTKLTDRTYEYACHEGNYGLQNILEGGRRNDRLGLAQTGGQDRGE